MYNKIALIFCFTFIVFGLFACGFVSELGNNRLAGVSQQASKSRTAGTYNSPAGRLSSSDTCSENDDCKDLCDSMLKKLSDQKDCYKKKEKEVQVFRDVYNLLATGDPRRMVSIDSDEMEDFLVFGPVLWKDAIYGFERNRKENCRENRGEDDPRDREDCKLKGYYKQEGYDEEGAGEALKWIARNNWVAELLLEHDDEDNYVMLSLLDVLAFGEGGVEAQPDNLKCATANTEHPCRKLHDSSFGSIARTVLPESVGLKQHYSYVALAKPLVEGEEEDYFSLADEDTDEPSYKLGEEILEELCSDASNRNSCKSQFTSRSACPADGTEPDSSNILAEITFESHNSNYFYEIDSGYCYLRNRLRDDGRGTSTPPSQNIILELSDYSVSGKRGELLLDNDQIDYESNKTYYLYIDSKRHTLSRDYKQRNYRESCSTHDRSVAWWRGFMESSDRFSSGSSYNVYIASEEDGVCEYYTP